MSVLPDFQIRELCEPEEEKHFTGKFKHGDPNSPIFRSQTPAPLIEPFTTEQVEPASYDVRLGSDFKIFQRDDTESIDFANPADITKDVHISDGGYFLLHPGEFALGVTIEKLYMPDNLVARIEGKSSVGRLGLMVHITAGFIDPGFCGPVTLEMVGVHPLPLKLRPGQLIAQISFQWMAAPAAEPYQGRYQGAQGVESSKYGQGD